MTDVSGPVIVRRSSSSTYYAKPGIHSYNAKRRLNARRSRVLGKVRALLLIVGLCCIGYYGYVTSDAYFYQAYQNWAFDQQIAGRHEVTFGDYLRERTRFGFLAGTKAPQATVATSAPPPIPSEAPRPAQGSLLGRLEIARLNLAAMVREGVDANTLKIAVGHVPSTALPNEPGNFAIAAHRDTLFRALKDIKKYDLVTLQSPTGNYTYQVLATKIVKPSDVSVLRADGGGMIPPAAISSDHGAPGKLLTMITCYPFNYFGSAPKRFIVEAKLISTTPAINTAADEARGRAPPVS
jgi:sortase A